MNLGTMTALIWLNASFNELQEELNCDNLPVSLRSVNLQNNLITGKFSDCNLSRFKDLDRWDLSENLIDDIYLSVDYPTLKYLSLSGNRFEGHVGRLHLASKAYLSIEGNPFLCPYPNDITTLDFTVQYSTCNPFAPQSLYILKIAGGVVGSLVFVAFISYIVWLCCRTSATCAANIARVSRWVLLWVPRWLLVCMTVVKHVVFWSASFYDFGSDIYFASTELEYISQLKMTDCSNQNVNFDRHFTDRGARSQYHTGNGDFNTTIYFDQFNGVSLLATVELSKFATGCFSFGQHADRTECIIQSDQLGSCVQDSTLPEFWAVFRSLSPLYLPSPSSSSIPL